MDKEPRRLATAVGDLKNRIASNDSRLLTGGVMNSRKRLGVRPTNVAAQVDWDGVIR